MQSFTVTRTQHHHTRRTAWHRGGPNPDPSSSTTALNSERRSTLEHRVWENPPATHMVCWGQKLFQEADSQYIEERSLSKRMFSDITFQNSFLSFPASWWCFFQLRERVSALSVLPVVFRSVTHDNPRWQTQRCTCHWKLPGAQTAPSPSVPADRGPGTEGIHKLNFPLHLLPWLEKFSTELG